MTRGVRRYVAARTVKGRTYYYFRATWTAGCVQKERLIRLPDNPDSPEFDKEYWLLRSGKHEALKAPVKTSYSALIRSYRASRKYKALAASTRAQYDIILNDIEAKNGGKDVRKTTRSAVRAIHERYADTPRMADWRLQILSILFNHAVKVLEWVPSNPASGIEKFGAQREYEPWPLERQTAFQNAARSLGDDLVLMAFHLGTGTGQRPGDLCAMEWDHYDGQYIAVVQDKQREAGPQERLWVACPPKLRAFLDASPRQGRFLLAKNLTQALTYGQLEKRFRRVRDAAGIKAGELNMHGWRKTAATELAEAGASDAEIAAVTGHKSLQMVQHYRKKAQRKVMSKNAQERRK